MLNNKKLGFVTCVELGLECMKAICDAGAKLDIAITLKDYMAKSKSGRVYIDDFCNQHSIPIAKIRNINEPEAIQAIKEAGIDWLFIIGWSQIAKPEILNAPNLGCIGIHPTLLPQGRGRAAIPWAILKGLEKTGVTLFKLDEGVDTGPIIDQWEIPLTDQTDASELYEKATEAHYAVLSRNLPALIAGTAELKSQDNSKASEWPGRKPEDGRIDPSMTRQEAHALIRAVTHPYPGAFYDLKKGRVIIWRASLKQQSKDDHVIELADGPLFCTDWEIHQ